MLKAISEIGRKNDEANKILLDVKKIDAKLDTAELVCTKTDGTKYDFNRFAFPLKLFEKIYSRKITLYEAREKQAELKELINKLNDYGPRIKKKKKIEEKNRVLKSARKLSGSKDDIINLFEKGTFPYKGNVFRTKEEESEEEPEEESEEKKLEK